MQCGRSSQNQRWSTQRRSKLTRPSWPILTYGRLTISSFINDIPRWASLLSLQDQRLLDEIVLSIWGTTIPTQQSGRSFTCAQTLEFLQELVGNLVRASRPVDHDPRSSWASGSYRLPALRKRHTSGKESDSPGEERLSLRKWKPFPSLDILESAHVDRLEPSEPEPPEPEPEKELSVLARITVLMAGAIFGAIILYLCRTYWGIPHILVQANTSAVFQWGLPAVHHLVLFSDAGQDWDSNQIMAQNCAILSKYTAYTDLVDSGGSMSAFDWLPYTPPDSTGSSAIFAVDGIQTQGAVPSTCGGDSSVVSPSR